MFGELGSGAQKADAMNASSVIIGSNMSFWAWEKTPNLNGMSWVIAAGHCEFSAELLITRQTDELIMKSSINLRALVEMELAEWISGWDERFQLQFGR